MHRMQILQLIDRLDWRLLLGMIFATVIAPAFMYYLLSSISPSHGIIPPKPDLIKINGREGVVDSDQVTFGDSVYFSVVTVATLGYGDYRPVGWSRVVASVQVILGLLLAGMCVAKLTAIASSEERRVARAVCGYWIDQGGTTPQGLPFIGLIHIYMYNGMILLHGRNIDCNANLINAWNSRLIAIEWPELLFKFHNSASRERNFTNGYTVMSFNISSDDKAYSFVSSILDIQQGVYQFQGCRVTDSQTIKQLESGCNAMTEAIRKLVRDNVRIAQDESPSI